MSGRDIVDNVNEVRQPAGARFDSNLDREQALANAARAAGISSDAAGEVADNYGRWLELERAGCSLNHARRKVAYVRKVGRAVRGAAYMPPDVLAVGGIRDRWPEAAARAVEALAELERLATAAGVEVEAQAADAGYINGGRSNLAHLIAEPAKVRMVRELATLVSLARPGTVSSTPDGPFHCLCSAVNDIVTHEGDRGIYSAIRAAGIARTYKKKAG